MERINQIINNADYSEHIRKIFEYETNRKYCHHDHQHFIDVARISYIISLEENCGINKEVIYAAGLLHDIGRWLEYEKGMDHAEAGRVLAHQILSECGFIQKEINEITEAIAGHRKNIESSRLADILYRADKFSRDCYSCASRSTCKWFQNGEKPYVYY